MTDLDEILSAIDEFFGDTSRPASETREGLERIVGLGVLCMQSATPQPAGRDAREAPDEP